MAKSRGEDTIPSGTLVLPEKRYVTLTTLAAGEVLHRIHLHKYGAAEFNPGIQGNARFSPIQDGQGQPSVSATHL